MEGLRWNPKRTRWASYTLGTSYTEEAAGEKCRLVRDLLARTSGEWVWDLGANTGTFSILAASLGRRVVAMDADPGTVEQLYLTVRRGQAQGVMPIVMDLANPSPALGWMGVERHSLVERGPVPVVLALALVHHLAISNNLPLDEISRLFVALASEAIVEFVPKDDPQVRSLLADRQDIFDSYTIDAFRDAVSRDFNVEAVETVPDSLRTLFLLRRRT